MQNREPLTRRRLLLTVLTFLAVFAAVELLRPSLQSALGPAGLTALSLAIPALLVVTGICAWRTEIAEGLRSLRHGDASVDR
jgi:hypothetical protein